MATTRTLATTVIAAIFLQVTYCFDKLDGTPCFALPCLALAVRQLVEGEQVLLSFLQTASDVVRLDLIIGRLRCYPKMRKKRRKKGEEEEEKGDEEKEEEQKRPTSGSGRNEG